MYLVGGKADLALALFLSVVLFPGFLSAGDGLIARWTFEEGSGNTVRDVSGNNHDGRIHGAVYVPHGDGFALEFDGAGAHVDFGAPEELNLRDSFTLELWIQFSTEPEGDGLHTVAGKDIGHYAVIFNPRSEMAWFFAPQPVRSFAVVDLGRWRHIVATYEKGAGRFYLDGEEAWFQRMEGREGQIPPNADIPFSIGGRPSDNTHELPAGSSFKGLISEATVYSRALRSDEVKERYADSNLSGAPEIMADYVPPVHKIAVDVLSRPLGELPEGARVRVWLERNGRVIARQTDGILTRSFRSFEFSTEGLTPGGYSAAAEILCPAGEPLSEISAVTVEIPPDEPFFPKETPYGRRLNNLVTEMISVDSVPENAGSFSFRREREGWTFVSVDLELEADDTVDVSVLRADGAEETWLSVDESSVQEPWEGDGRTWEIMRRLPAGKHELRIDRGGAPRIKRLIVRSVPQIGWHDVQSVDRFDGHEGLRGPDYYAERALRNVNLFLHGSRIIPREHHSFIRRWQATGRQAFTYAILPHPGRGNWTEEQMTAEDITGFWMENYSNPILDGIFIDELHGRVQYAGVYEEAIQLFEEKTGQTAYIFTGNTFRAPQNERVLDAAIETGGRIAWEVYLTDERSLLLEWRSMQSLLHNMGGWRRILPGNAPYVMVAIGTMSIPTASLHHWPKADFKVHLDLFMNTIANYPEFSDTAGVHNFKARQNEQELVEWISSLFRHYFIEGHRDVLSETPYVMGYAKNPGFVDGLDRWETQPAEPGSIRAGNRRGFANLQGHAWSQLTDASGDSAVIMRRSARKPNKISQVLEGLTPGRLYAVSVVAADYDDMSEKADYPLHIDVNVGKENMIQRYSYTFNNLNHVSLEYPERRTAWMNYHRLVFRAAEERAGLTISDWERPDEPGGHTGREMMISFVEVKPYFHPGEKNR